MDKFVIYRRVSGGLNQIKSGYGLDVQSTEIDSFLNGLTDYKIIDDFTEIAFFDFDRHFDQKKLQQ